MRRHNFSLRRSGALLLAGALLAGCAPGTGIGDLSGLLIEGYTGPSHPDSSPRMQELMAAGQPQAILRLLDREQATLLVLGGERDGVRRWRSLDNAQVHTRDGMIVTTRALDHDLMSAETGAAVALVSGGRSGQITRIQRELDGQDRIRIRSFVCDIAPQGMAQLQTGETDFVQALVVHETCHGATDGFLNRYWVRDGRILQAEQWIGPELGRLQILFMP